VPLNDHQKRHLLASFRHADKLLADVETFLAPAGVVSPFARYIQDLSPVQRKVTADTIVRLRERMAQALKGLDVVLPKPDVSGLWAIRTTLLSVGIALAELAPRSMRGYGPMDPEDEGVLTGLVAELERMLQRLSTYLSAGRGHDFGERLAHLERAGQEVTLLQTLEQVVTRQGLVEFRPALDHILEHLESRCYEIALFGRVSCGKSSLLNRLLRTEVLPVGVTPVTALPTRIAYGEQPGVEILYADRPTERVDVGRLAEYVSEQGNPGNRRHVSGVLVRIPSSRLAEGIVLVDTPGIGSLATSGTEEALAYLPHCDLGIVLIDGGSAIDREDLELLQLLYESGIPGMVLISKCDLLTAPDLEHVVGYVGDRLASELGWSLPIHAVSTIEPHARRLDEWFGRQILPLYEQHQSLALASTHRKTGQLRDSVAAAICSLMARSQAARSSLAEAEVAQIRALLGAGTRQIEEGRKACLQVVEALPGMAEPLILSVANAVVSQWHDGPQADLEAAFRGAVAEAVAPQGGAVYRAAQELDVALRQRLLALREHVPTAALPDAPDAEGRLSEFPAPEAFLSLILPIALPRPSWFRWLQPLGRTHAERRVRQLLGRRLVDGLETYARFLRAWAASRIDHLAERYDSVAGACRLHLGAGSDAGQATGPPDREGLLADLRALEPGNDGNTAAPTDVPVHLMKAG
jgi:GTP-binding protein EngB required for normal cell division